MEWKDARDGSDRPRFLLISLPHPQTSGDSIQNYPHLTLLYDIPSLAHATLKFWIIHPAPFRYRDSKATRDTKKLITSSRISTTPVPSGPNDWKVGTKRNVDVNVIYGTEISRSTE